MLNDTSMASAGFYIRTCRRIRNSKKFATIRNFHQNICVNPTILEYCDIYLKSKDLAIKIPKVVCFDINVKANSQYYKFYLRIIQQTIASFHDEKIPTFVTFSRHLDILVAT